MKAPPRLQALIDEGLIDTVVRQLMSGKEAINRSFPLKPPHDPRKTHP